VPARDGRGAEAGGAPIGQQAVAQAARRPGLEDARMTAPRLRALSLGAGVQSTALALMAAHGEIGPMPDCAIFADTQDEPAGVYEHLRWLMSPGVLPFPVHIVTAGRLSEHLFAGDDEARIPFFVKGSGISKRQCTRNFKLRPIRRKMRELLGVGPRGYVGAGWAEMWVGISTDEASRVKPSGYHFISRRDPLIEAGISRRDCEAWLLGHDHKIPGKSSCVYCPYQSKAQWRDKPAVDFATAVAIDRRLRTPENIARFRGELYVHASRTPLEDVDFSARATNQRQPDLFNEECEGMCGV
jgi:hypothetical protein